MDGFSRAGATIRRVLMVMAAVGSVVAVAQPVPPPGAAPTIPAPGPGAPFTNAPATSAPATGAPADTTVPGPTPPATAAQPAPASPPSAVVTSPPLDDGTSVQSIDIRARPALVLAGSADWESGYKLIGAALAKVRAAATKAGLKPTGHAVAAFIDTDDNGFKFEAMLPIEKAPEGPVDFGEGVKIGATPAGKALKFQHRGAYDDIDTTYEAITAYLDEKGLEAQNLFVEEYLNEAKGADDTAGEVDIYVLIK